MAVDEFGREIPAARGGGGGRRSQSPSPPPRGGSGIGNNNNNNSSGSTRVPSHLYDSLPTSRYDGGDRDRDRDRGDHRGGDRGGADDRGSSRKRKHRSRSPMPSRRGGRDGNNNNNNNDGGGGGNSRDGSSSNNNHNSNNYGNSKSSSGNNSSSNSNSNSKNQPPHPSVTYVEEPMLCQFLWKEANEGKADADYDEYRKSYCLNYVRTFFNEHMDDSWFRSFYSPLARYEVGQQEQNRAAREASDFSNELESSLAKLKTTAEHQTNNNHHHHHHHESSTNTKTNSNSNESLSFFVLKARLGGGIRQAGNKPDYHHGGSSSHHHNSSSHHGSSHHHHGSSSSSYHHRQHHHHHSSPSKSSRQSSSSSSSLVNPIPATHVLALTNRVLPILEIPHYVTDEQLTVAVMQQLPSKVSKEISMDPSSMVLYSGLLAPDLTRTAYLRASDEIRKEIIHALNQSGSSNSGGNHHNKNSSSSSSNHHHGKDNTASSHVPRKEDTFVPKTLELVVECSDAYGRMEVDADGKGGVPEERGGVPQRKASVWVSTRPLSPSVRVLSAALSATARIRRDQVAALQLARTFDVRRNIPSRHRLDALLPRAVPRIAGSLSNPNNNNNNNNDNDNDNDNDANNNHSSNHNHHPPSQAVEDALDVTISYLRRVHLFSYYNGCQLATRAAEVFDGNHAVSTIHLRLANADEMLAVAEPTIKGGAVGVGATASASASANAGAAATADNPAAMETTTSDNNINAAAAVVALPKIDLLVQRLNDSIESALKQSEEWIASNATNNNNDDGDDGIVGTADSGEQPPICIVIDKETDRQARDIKYQESQVEGGWITDHAIDEDGRARCAFHFCRKLFKDSSFLKKHLIKKHSEFLRAEIAKCHDSYMMTSWDAQEQRPVPPILVDCGHRFGLKPSPVLGASEPLAEDPEPQLWKREEERREFEEKEAEARRERFHNNNQSYHNNNTMNDGAGGGGGPSMDLALSEGRGQGRKTNFEDVDDMKVEQVEIAFDKIEHQIPQPLSKKPKKKKKRKLL